MMNPVVDGGMAIADAVPIGSFAALSCCAMPAACRCLSFLAPCTERCVTVSWCETRKQEPSKDASRNALSALGRWHAHLRRHEKPCYDAWHLPVHNWCALHDKTRHAVVTACKLPCASCSDHIRRYYGMP